MPFMSSPPGTEVQVDGKNVLYFAGTAYFALQGDPRVIEAACAAVRKYGVHPATSRSGFGETSLLRSVEQSAARFFGVDDALYFAAGYAGPCLLMQAAEHRYDLIAVDESVHLASQDAVDQHGAMVVRFRHLDPQHLEEVLAQHRTATRVAVLCDGVSPVLGDIAPANDYLNVLERMGGGILVIDDAHGVGVLGKNGRGTLEYAADTSGRPIAVNTYSNASPRETLD
ncbi:MAG: pyridoxal phosphate-dependent aminotransferase family protein [Burkholderiales bacterium]|nr:MAG: pyridoxal phosphate-dependent aminotransferase family protein [Burkholderiales bacterium]